MTLPAPDLDELDLVVRMLEDLGGMNGTQVENLLVASRGWACENCGGTCAALQIDHVNPRPHHGCDHVQNVQWLCPPCNQSKGPRTMEEWQESGLAEDMAATSPCRDISICGHVHSPRSERLFGKPWDGGKW